MKTTLLLALMSLSFTAFAECPNKFCATKTFESGNMILNDLKWDDYEVSADVNMAKLACEAFGSSYLPGSMVKSYVNTEAEIAPITIVWMEGEIMLLSSRSTKRKVISSIMCTGK